jgi:hypothetical protein
LLFIKKKVMAACTGLLVVAVGLATGAVQAPLAHATITHHQPIVYIWGENQSYSAVTSCNSTSCLAPYENDFDKSPSQNYSCGGSTPGLLCTTGTGAATGTVKFTGAYAGGHFSNPNYIDGTAGSAFGQYQLGGNNLFPDPWGEGCSDVCLPNGTLFPGSYVVNNIFNQLHQAGYNTTALEEDLPSTKNNECLNAKDVTYTSTTGASWQWVRRHDPPIFFNDLGSSSTSACASINTSIASHKDTNGVPDQGTDSWPTTLPDFSFVTPNIPNDGHKPGTLATFDKWLANNVPTLIGKGATVIVTYDEGIGNACPSTGTCGGQIFTAIADGSTAYSGQATNSQAMNIHEAVLGALEKFFALDCLTLNVGPGTENGNPTQSPACDPASAATPIQIPYSTNNPAVPSCALHDTSGAQGASITIDGQHLSGTGVQVSTVQFNRADATASVNSNTGTSMKVNVPTTAIPSNPSIYLTTTGGGPVLCTGGTFTVTGTNSGTPTRPTIPTGTTGIKVDNSTAITLSWNASSDSSDGEGVTYEVARCATTSTSTSCTPGSSDIVARGIPGPTTGVISWTGYVEASTSTATTAYGWAVRACDTGIGPNCSAFLVF